MISVKIYFFSTFHISCETSPFPLSYFHIEAKHKFNWTYWHYGLLLSKMLFLGCLMPSRYLPWLMSTSRKKRGQSYRPLFVKFVDVVFVGWWWYDDKYLFCSNIVQIIQIYASKKNKEDSSEPGKRQLVINLAALCIINPITPRLHRDYTGIQLHALQTTIWGQKLSSFPWKLNFLSFSKLFLHYLALEPLGKKICFQWRYYQKRTN